MTSGPVPLPGMHCERLLGAGAFADVYLYRQELPQRPVAVKVMREPVSDGAALEAFETEANLLAAVSSHPSIVTIHHAAVSRGGRPYLVMEYCSRPSPAERIRERPLSVPEMLQTTIRLAGAVETAHRAGILHRDIKPANLLTTDYGWPALGDFGISALAAHSAEAHDAMSLPWSAPEVVAGQRFRRTSDVYALAATAYTLLAGHAPFDDDGLTSSALMARILGGSPPPIARADVPEALQRLLAVALARDPGHRPQSASEFGRGLQRIEQDLHLPTTHLDIPAAHLGDVDDDVEATRLGGPDLDDRTVVVSRPRAGDHEPEDRTVVASRTDEAFGAPEDRTVLSARRTDRADDDRTVLSGRTAVDDRTVARPAVSSLAPPLTRTAVGPRTGRPETYGIRTAPPAAVTRMTVAAPERIHDDAAAATAGARRRRRLRVRLALVIGGAVLAVGALGAAAVAALAGGA